MYLQWYLELLSEGPEVQILLGRASKRSKMLAGLADNERFCYFLNTLVTQNSIQKDQFPANILVLLCICTTLYNETLRCCFAVGEKKKNQKIDD